MKRVSERVVELTDLQQDDATRDAFFSGVGTVGGVLLILPALFFIVPAVSGDHSAELARLKGEVVAVESVAVDKECPFAPAIKAAQQQREIEAEKQLPAAQRAAAQEARFRSFETRLDAAKTELTHKLNRYNREVEFKTSSHQPGVLLGIKDVSRVTVVDWRQEGYVVRIVGNSGLTSSWSYEVYDEHFLIQDRDGQLAIKGHGKNLVSRTNITSRPRDEKPSEEAERRAFEMRLRGSQAELVSKLNRYNKDTEFKGSSHQPGTLANVKDVSSVTVLGSRKEGYIVRLVGTSGLSASWTNELYDEVFLIEDGSGGLRILAHGKHLDPARTIASRPAVEGPLQEAELRTFETRLKASQAELLGMLNRYNKEAEFKTSSHQPGMLLKIKDVSGVTVVGSRQEGYIVHIVGNSGLSASWADELYDEHFLIEERGGQLAINGHGNQLAPQQFSALE